MSRNKKSIFECAKYRILIDSKVNKDCEDNVNHIFRRNHKC
jgi:hypothetical protein